MTTHASGRGIAPTLEGEPTAARRSWWLVAAAAGAVAALHFALLVVWLVPSGAAPGLRRAAQAYVAPVFAQNWWLFAPDPAVVDRRVEVRGSWVEAGTSRSTPWLPLIAPLTVAVQSNPLTPRNATWIAALGATYALADPTGPLRLRGEARDLVLRSWSEPARQPAALIVLERIGSQALAAAHPGVPLEQVQLRLTIRPLPAFASPAGEPAGDADALLFPPVPFAGDLPLGSGGR